VQKLYTNILKTIKDYEESKLLYWQKEIEESSDDKLKQALLCKDENGLLKVNFDPALVRLLREVKYLKQLHMTVPQTAESIFEKANTYRYQTVSLDMIVQNYNKIITCLNEVEEPLVKKRIQAMDKDVEPGIITYKWKSPEINDFIKKTKDTVDSLYEIVDKMKKSLENITNELLKFKKPMVERKNKPISPE
jgi:dynein heavy chain